MHLQDAAILLELHPKLTEPAFDLRRRPAARLHLPQRPAEVEERVALAVVEVLEVDCFPASERRRFLIDDLLEARQHNLEGAATLRSAAFRAGRLGCREIRNGPPCAAGRRGPFI